MYRIIRIITEIKSMPRQNAGKLSRELGISRSQFYKDKAALAELGFEFEYSHSRGRFVITRDILLTEDLTLSERLSLIMAFRQLSAAGDHILTYKGLSAARKLAAGLPEPLRESLFDDIVLKEGFGCSGEVMNMLQQAVTESRRVLLTYRKPDLSGPEIHDLDPYHLFFRRRALYVEGYSYTEKGIRMYRLNRIDNVEFTRYLFTVPKEYDFGRRHRNAFSAFPGETTERVAVRFDRRTRPYIEESLWHHSQQIAEEPEGGGIIFTVEIAYPREVMWWSLFWGTGAEIIEPDWLREEAKQEVEKMGERYGDR